MDLFSLPFLRGFAASRDDILSFGAVLKERSIIDHFHLLT